MATLKTLRYFPEISRTNEFVMILHLNSSYRRLIVLERD